MIKDPKNMLPQKGKTWSIPVKLEKGGVTFKFQGSFFDKNWLVIVLI